MRSSVTWKQQSSAINNFCGRDRHPSFRSFIHSRRRCHLVVTSIWQQLVTHSQLVSMGPTHLELSVSSHSSSECSRNFSFLASTSIFSECSEKESRDEWMNVGMEMRDVAAKTCLHKSSLKSKPLISHLFHKSSQSAAPLLIITLIDSSIDLAGFDWAIVW